MLMKLGSMFYIYNLKKQQFFLMKVIGVFSGIKKWGGCYHITLSPSHRFPRGTWERRRQPVMGISGVTSYCLLTCASKAWEGLWRNPVWLAITYPSTHYVIWKSLSLRLSIHWQPTIRPSSSFNVLTLAPTDF